MRDKHEPTMFAVHDLVKDLALAIEVYERANAVVPLTRQTRELFDETASASSDLDISAIVTAYSSGNRRAPSSHGDEVERRSSSPSS